LERERLPLHKNDHRSALPARTVRLHDPSAPSAPSRAERGDVATHQPLAERTRSGAETDAHAHLRADRHYDAQTVGDAACPSQRFAALGCDILLLGCSKSAPNLTASLDGLAKAMPTAKRVVLQGAGHAAPDNSRQPARVSAELRSFFA
jgi:hypothetical protein